MSGQRISVKSRGGTALIERIVSFNQFARLFTLAQSWARLPQNLLKYLAYFIRFLFHRCDPPCCRIATQHLLTGLNGLPSRLVDGGGGNILLHPWNGVAVEVQAVIGNCNSD